MKSQALVTVFGLLLSIGTACSSSSPATGSTGGASSAGGGTSTGGSGNATGGSGGAPSTVVQNCPTIQKDSSGNYKISSSAANNYSFTSNIQLGTQQVVASKTDLTFDWSALTTDMYNETINPTSGIGTFVLALYHLSKADLQTKINADSLLPQDRVAVGTYLTGGTVNHCSTATDLSVLGQPLNHDTLLGFLDASTYGTSDYTYLALVGAGTEYGKNSRMITNFAVGSSAQTTTVSIKPDSTIVTFTATLDKLTPTPFPVGKSNIDFSWSTMTANALGHTVDSNTIYNITKVLVASFTQPVSELQKNSNFLNLESLATNEWTNSNLSGTDLVLSTLTDKNNNAFTGIDSSHTWIIALMCDSCLNPAPWYISVLQPCSG